MSAIVEAILHTIAEPVLTFLGRIVLWLILYLVAFPLLCIVSTPVILINAFFRGGSYSQNVISGYKGVCAWLVWFGPGLPP